jgi:hypothetical protein
VSAQVAALILAVLWLPCAAAAQKTLMLRHDAAPGTIVHTAFETATVVWAFDGRRFESTDLGMVRAVTLRGPGGKTVIHLAYDSVRTRTRGSDGGWREFSMPVDSVWIQATVDERLRVSSLNEGHRIAGVTSLMRVLTGVPGLELPAARLAEGDGWRNETVASVVPGLRNETVRPLVEGTVRVVLDSIVVRTNDTLGYLSLSGEFPAATFVDVVGPGRVTATGDVVGNLIWSTAWSGFVSGVSKTRMTVSRAVPGGEGVGVEELRVEATTRCKVKPQQR